MKSARHDYLKLYAITDDGPNLIERVRLALEGGATCIQHRAKGASFEAAKADALAIQSLCRTFGVPFIVNDSLELALAIGADGLHVGQSDTAAREARRALGPDAILGVSAATVAAAVAPSISESLRGRSPTPSSHLATIPASRSVKLNSLFTALSVI